MPGSSPAGVLHLLGSGTSIFHKRIATLLLRHGTSRPPPPAHDSFAAWGLRVPRLPQGEASGDGVNSKGGRQQQQQQQQQQQRQHERHPAYTYAGLGMDVDWNGLLAADGRSTAPFALHNMVSEWTAQLAEVVFRHCPAAASLATLGGVTTEVDRHTPLHVAAAAGDARMVGTLLHHGSAAGTDLNKLLNARTARTRRTPLHLAVIAGSNEAVVKVILDHARVKGGAAVADALRNYRDSHKRVAADYAGSPEVASALRGCEGVHNDAGGKECTSSTGGIMIADDDDGQEQDGVKPLATAANTYRNGAWWSRATTSSGDGGGWGGGGGGDSTRGSCDFDVVNATELSVDVFKTKYLDGSIPLLIRGVSLKQNQTLRSRREHALSMRHPAVGLILLSPSLSLPLPSLSPPLSLFWCCLSADERSVGDVINTKGLV